MVVVVITRTLRVPGGYSRRIMELIDDPNGGVILGVKPVETSVEFWIEIGYVDVIDMVSVPTLLTVEGIPYKDC